MKQLLLAGTMLATFGATAATAETRGPDSAGYVATDQVTYTFNDIRSTGTKVLVDTDDTSVAVNMGMNFSMYGNTYSTAYISSNGTIFFGSANSGFTNQDLSTTQVGGVPGIFTFWDDLVTYDTRYADRGVYYQTIGDVIGQRKFVVQEIASYFGRNTNPVNFQTVLDEATGDILMRYTDAAFGDPAVDNGISATVGIQGNLSLGQSVQWSFNTASLRDNQSLCFTQNANAACNAIVDPVAGVPEPATWGLMIAGFGLVGAAMRRRSTKVAFA